MAKREGVKCRLLNHKMRHFTTCHLMEGEMSGGEMSRGEMSGVKCRGGEMSLDH
ncbi:MAG: hypothetical protein GY820_06845 [Gammaproteobacteria bacterium]|nr:hypothetical protein [Gammaproteobacteria bacterium]